MRGLFYISSVVWIYIQKGGAEKPKWRGIDAEWGGYDEER